mmetsp:Transcript_75888/g.175966  ORF Transcript_75888/g.175966 Transcript_75888/m.175966 type:complete len:245 (+) Transcript_75888:710-1444(+)
MQSPLSACTEPWLSLWTASLRELTPSSRVALSRTSLLGSLGRSSTRSRDHCTSSPLAATAAKGEATCCCAEEEKRRWSKTCLSCPKSSSDPRCKGNTSPGLASCPSTSRRSTPHMCSRAASPACDHDTLKAVRDVKTLSLRADSQVSKNLGWCCRPTCTINLCSPSSTVRSVGTRGSRWAPGGRRLVGLSEAPTTSRKNNGSSSVALLSSRVLMGGPFSVAANREARHPRGAVDAKPGLEARGK